MGTLSVRTSSNQDTLAIRTRVSYISQDILKSGHPSNQDTLDLSIRMKRENYIVPESDHVYYYAHDSEVLKTRQYFVISYKWLFSRVEYNYMFTNGALIFHFKFTYRYIGCSEGYIVKL